MYWHSLFFFLNFKGHDPFGRYKRASPCGEFSTLSLHALLSFEVSLREFSSWLSGEGIATAHGFALVFACRLWKPKSLSPVSNGLACELQQMIA